MPVLVIAPLLVVPVVGSETMQRLMRNLVRLVVGVALKTGAPRKLTRSACEEQRTDAVWVLCMRSLGLMVVQRIVGTMTWRMMMVVVRWLLTVVGTEVMM